MPGTFSLCVCGGGSIFVLVIKLGEEKDDRK